MKNLLCIIFIVSSVLCCSQTLICDGSQKYLEFAEYITKHGEKVSYKKGKSYDCLFYYNIIDSSKIEGKGFYSLKSGGIHSMSHIFVEYENGKRYYLKKYNIKEFLKFVNKHLDKVFPEKENKDKCVILNKLVLFWCNHVEPFMSYDIIL